MRKHILVATVAALALIPSLAAAQSSCEQRAQNRRAVGTVVGAVAGALLGNAVAHGGGRVGGTIIGGVAGAAVGNQVAKGTNPDCHAAYGYYDDNNRWHANHVARAEARGYYDAYGNWVDGPPAGYYDRNGAWVSASVDVDTAGYYTDDGYWVPASAEGYYDSDGHWVAGYAPGFYDSDGRWHSGRVRGHYDADGRWVEGEPAGHMDTNGVWIADAAPGYYDASGHWIRGESMGYYDANGRWVIETSGAKVAAVNDGGDRRGYWTDAGPDTLSREKWLGHAIRGAMDRGDLAENDGNRALSVLEQIHRDDVTERDATSRHSDAVRNGEDIQARLDDLADSVKIAIHVRPN